MLINEVAKKCGITKKAVQYYVEQHMVNPNVLENGYKDFAAQDVEIIKRIVLYRRLGLSIPEIKQVLEKKDNVKNILYQKTLDMEKEKIRHSILKTRLIQKALLLKDYWIYFRVIMANLSVLISRDILQNR